MISAGSINKDIKKDIKKLTKKRENIFKAEIYIKSERKERILLYLKIRKILLYK